MKKFFMLLFTVLMVSCEPVMVFAQDDVQSLYVYKAVKYSSNTLNLITNEWGGWGEWKPLPKTDGKDIFVIIDTRTSTINITNKGDIELKYYSDPIIRIDIDNEGMEYRHIIFKCFDVDSHQPITLRFIKYLTIDKVQIVIQYQKISFIYACLDS